MMKTAYKFSAFAAALIIAGSPLIVSAQNLKERAEERKAERQTMIEERQANRQGLLDERQKAFCTRFIENASQISARLDERSGKIDERQDNRLKRLEEKRTKRDQLLEGKRDGGDERRVQMYAKLLEKADTDAEKAAVEKFKTTVEAAIKTRRTAVDAAITSFRTSVENTVSGRQSGIDSVKKKFTSATNAALAEAKASCEKGTDAKTVREEFLSDMQAAREALQSDRQASDKVVGQVKALAKTRQTSLEKAFTDFRTTLEAAQKELKAAFGE